MSDASAFVSVRGLTKEFGKRVVVDSVSFDLQAGEFLSLLGPSGSGKTTILRMIAGLAHPDGGTIRIGEQVVFENGKETPVEERGLGMVFQDYALWPHMTVEGNIAFGLRLRHLSGGDVRARIAEVLELVDLMGMERRYPNQLSGGQQQRVAIARALATRPKLLLMDEPLSSLDTGLREVMREELGRIFRETRMTVVNVTHDQDEAMVMSDRIVLLRDGKVEQFGAPAELYAQPRSAFVGSFLGAANVFRGAVTAVEGEKVTLGVGDLRLTGRRAPEYAVAVGDEAALLCRLEHVRLLMAEPDASAARENTFRGAVTRASFAGGRWRIVAQVAQGIEIAATSQVAPPREGAIWLGLPTEHLLLVAPDDYDARIADGPRTTTQGAVLAGMIS